MKKIDIPGWKKEQAEIRQKEAVRSAQYNSLREKLDQMLNVKYCVYTAKKHEQSISVQQKAQQQRKAGVR